MRTPVQIGDTSVAFNTGTTRGVTCSPTYDTESAKAVLSSSLPYDVYGLLVHINSTLGDFVVVRLYAGGSGSEVEIAAARATASATVGGQIYFPIFIAAGTRLTVTTYRKDNGGGGLDDYVYATLFKGRSYDPACSRVTIAPAVTVAPPDVDAGATANTKGAWVQLTSSLARDIRGFQLVTYGDTSCDTDGRFSIDVAVGGSGSEQIILADVLGGQRQFSNDFLPSMTPIIWTPLAAGTRIAVRCSCSHNTASSRVPRPTLNLFEA